MKSQLQRHLLRPFFFAPNSVRQSWRFLPAHPQSLITTLSCSRSLSSFRPRVTQFPQLESPNGRGPQRHLQSSFTSGLITSIVIVAVGTYLSAYIESQHHPSGSQNLSDSSSSTKPMAPILEGRPGNLTPDQEDKLRKLWFAIFQLFGQVDGNPADALAAKEKTATPVDEDKKKHSFGMFGRKHSKSTTSQTSPSKSNGEDDKYGETKQFHEALANHSPEAIREAIWSMVKHDHPDALVLRFLRARKWDVEKALVMLVSTMAWRHSEMHVDDDIMKNGEGGALAGQESGNAAEKRLGTDFLAQIRMGKSFLHGTDKQGRPICVVRVRLHKQGEQCEESLERYTVYIIETARMVLSPPVDTATIVFDMTGFSLANMDYTPVKFMIKCFEANYPECLGAVLVHNAPWVFQGIWKVIRGWLDPVVAAKVHFTNNKADLEAFIPTSQILKELGGAEDWSYKYVEPIPGENDLLKDTKTRDRLLAAREELVKQFEATTIEWIHKANSEEAAGLKAKRDGLVAQLREDYWKLDPYLRARSLYDRQGIIAQGGVVDWYTPKAPEPAVKPVAETSADDVD